MKRILLATPHMGGTELKYVNKAFEDNWVAPLGENVDNFEKKVKEYVGVNSSVALSSGTAALHLGLKVLGIKQGDYVFCSSLTFSASANPILYEKAIPVFIDSDEDTWNMSPKALEKALIWASENNKMPKAIVVVDLYGQCANYDEIIPLAKKYNVPILEDAAEGFGATYNGKKCGSFGEVSILSFNGNKIITTSGGGMLLTNDEKKASKVKFWATQAREQEKHYEHKELGYNYRLSNICAGIGIGQLDVLETRIEQKRAIYQKYKDAFSDLPVKMMPEIKNGKSTFWLSTMTFNDDCELQTYDLIDFLNEHNIEARPVWKPMHLQPIYKGSEFFKDSIDISSKLFSKGICLPSDTNMTEQELNYVIEVIRKFFLG